MNKVLLVFFQEIDEHKSVPESGVKESLRGEMGNFWFGRSLKTKVVKKNSEKIFFPVFV